MLFVPDVLEADRRLISQSLNFGNCNISSENKNNFSLFFILFSFMASRVNMGLFFIQWENT